jgi:hypothetical protein
LSLTLTRLDVLWRHAKCMRDTAATALGAGLCKCITYQWLEWCRKRKGPLRYALGAARAISGMPAHVAHDSMLIHCGRSRLEVALAYVGVEKNRFVSVAGNKERSRTNIPRNTRALCRARRLDFQTFAALYKAARWC